MKTVGMASAAMYRKLVDESLSKRIRKGIATAAKKPKQASMTPIKFMNLHITRKTDSKLAMRDALCSAVEAEMSRAKRMACSAAKKKIAGKAMTRSMARYSMRVLRKLMRMRLKGVALLLCWPGSRGVNASGSVQSLMLGVRAA